MKKNKKLDKVAGGGFFSALKSGASKAVGAAKGFAKSEAGQKLIDKGVEKGTGFIAKKTGMDDWD